MLGRFVAVGMRFIRVQMELFLDGIIFAVYFATCRLQVDEVLVYSCFLQVGSF